MRELQPFGSDRESAITLTLSVHDAHGRAASASLRVRIAGAPPTIASALDAANALS